MVSFTNLATTYLAFAASQGSRPYSSKSRTSRAPDNSGRGNSGNGNGQVGNRNKYKSKGGDKRGDPSPRREEVLAPPPPVTSLDGPFPTYFTCRHNYEEALVQELLNKFPDGDAQNLNVSSPSPGLVRTVTASSESAEQIQALDPIYALQSIPKCVVIEAPSIKQLAVQALTALQIDQDSLDSPQSQLLRQAPKGALAVHFLLPGMFKGQRDPVMMRRGEKVAAEAVKMLKKAYPCARRQAARDEDSDTDTTGSRWILQFLLFSPEVMAASLTQCATPVKSLPGVTWPNSHHPAGMANVDIVGDMPSSAYRKLLEALECMRVLPPRSNHVRDNVPAVVDLGACPGGWTAALRMMGAKVIAVDRTELQEDLMRDEMVEFIKGDAFTYSPPWAQDPPSARAPEGTWMVSDVIAYPERVAELLDRWCGGRWAGNMIVTAKFQGDSIPWEALNGAVQVATKHGYECRVKHFFNNKNEVTLMVSEADSVTNEHEANTSFLGKPMYPLGLTSD